MPPRSRIPRFAVARALLWLAAGYFLLLPLRWPRAEFGGGHYRLVDLALGLPLLAAALVATLYPRHRRAGLRLAAVFLAAGVAALAADAYYLFGYVDVLQPHWWHDERGFSLIGTRADPEFGFVMRPNRRWRMLSGAVHRTDARGFRNPPGLRRAEIVFVGDSFTENIAVPEGRTFPALVGQALGCAVANLGVSGYGPQQELRVLRRYALGYRPRWVVWQFFGGNDLTDAEVFARWERERTRPHPLPLKLRIVEHSLLIRLVTPQESFPVLAQLRTPDGTRVPIRRLRYYDAGAAARQPEGVRELAAAVAEGARFCREHNLRLLVVNVPQMAQVEAPRLEWVPTAPQLHLLPAGPGEDFATALRSACEAADVPFVDTAPALAAAGSRDNRDLYLPYDHHLGQRGNEVVAGPIIAELARLEGHRRAGR